MAINTDNITQHAQLKASSTSVLNQYAGLLGQLVFNKQTNHMHVMSGQAGTTYELANVTDITASKAGAYSKSESDSKFATLANTYTKDEVDQIALDSKVDLSGYLQKTEAESLYLGKTAKATSATTADFATKATQDGSGQVITSTYATKTELSTKADSSSLNNYVLTATAESTYAKKSDVTAVLKYKGTKDTQTSLPNSSNTTGDVWHVIDSGAEYAWNGSAWEPLGIVVDLSPYLTKSEATTTYATKTELATKANSTDVENTYAKKTELTSLATREEVEAKADASALNNYLPKTGGTISGSLIVTGTISGTATNATNAVNATKATQDASGNVITDTYATKTELSGYQVAGDYLTPSSNIDYARIINIPKIIDYGTLEG